MFTSYTATRQGKEFIGDSVARVLSQVSLPYTIAAVVPRMLTLFGADSQRYEVTAVDIVVRH